MDATTPPSQVQAVPTLYAGVTFRSALEASWAATLDCLGVTWKYEPETITLPSGSRYIPDFRLPAIGAWLEVKGDNIPRIEKARELGRTLACGCWPRTDCTCRWYGGEIVIIGHPARYSRINERRGVLWARWSSAHGGSCWFIRCLNCAVPGWTTSPACRFCHAPFGGQLIAPVDEQIELRAPVLRQRIAELDVFIGRTGEHHTDTA